MAFGVVIAVLLALPRVERGWENRLATERFCSCLAVPVFLWLWSLLCGAIDAETEVEAAFSLPLWVMLLAGALGGYAGYGSGVGILVVVVCMLGLLVMRLGDLRWLRRHSLVAVQIARGRLLTDPWDCEWYGQLADALLAQGKREEALKTLQRWRVRDPWSCEPQRRIAVMRIRPALSLSPAVIAAAAMFAVGLSYCAAAMG